jgi:hypothetical protein
MWTDNDGTQGSFRPQHTWWYNANVLHPRLQAGCYVSQEVPRKKDSASRILNLRSFMSVYKEIRCFVDGTLEVDYVPIKTSGQEGPAMHREL